MSDQQALDQLIASERAQPEAPFDADRAWAGVVEHQGHALPPQLERATADLTLRGPWSLAKITKAVGLAVVGATAVGAATVALTRPPAMVPPPKPPTPILSSIVDTPPPGLITAPPPPPPRPAHATEARARVRAPAPAREDAPSGSATDLLREAQLLREAWQALERRSFSTAAARIAEHARDFSQGRLREEREAARAILLCRRDRQATAAAQFDRRHPDSVHAERVDAACESVRVASTAPGGRTE